LVRTSPGRSVITKLIFSRFSSAYPKYTLYFNVPKSSHISPSCSSARTASSNQPITNVYKLTLCLSVHNVIQLLLLSTLRPAPVTSDVASISGYFRRCVHLRLLPTLHPAPVTSDVASISGYFRRCVQLLLLPKLRPSLVTSDVASSSCYFRRCVHLRLLPTLHPSPVTSDVASSSCYFLRCVHLRLLPTLRPSPVTSDVASISGYFRRCVHLQLLPTLRPLTALRTQYQPLHAANVPTPHDHSQQNQAPPHALLNTVLFS